MKKSKCFRDKRYIANRGDEGIDISVRDELQKTHFEKCAQSVAFTEGRVIVIFLFG